MPANPVNASLPPPLHAKQSPMANGRRPGVATIRKAFLLSPDRPMKDCAEVMRWADTGQAKAGGGAQCKLPADRALE